MKDGLDGVVAKAVRFPITWLVQSRRSLAEPPSQGLQHAKQVCGDRVMHQETQQ